MPGAAVLAWTLWLLGPFSTIGGGCDAGCGAGSSTGLPMKGTVSRLEAGPPAPLEAPSSLEPPPREPGPPRPETREAVMQAAAEARRLTETLTESGISPREAASVADMRGFRLYRRRRYAQALAWFEQAIRTDGSFELSRFNAARCAMLLDRPEVARGHLRALAALSTPMARSGLAMARRLTDFAALWASDLGTGAARSERSPSVDLPPP